jgi:hypothetical protein
MVMEDLFGPLLKDFKGSHAWFGLVIMGRSLLMAVLLVTLAESPNQSVILLSVLLGYGCTLTLTPYRDPIVFKMDLLMTTVDTFTLIVPVLYEYRHDEMLPLTDILTYVLIGGQVLTIVAQMVYAAILMRNHFIRLLTANSFASRFLKGIYAGSTRRTTSGGEASLQLEACEWQVEDQPKSLPMRASSVKRTGSVQSRKECAASPLLAHSTHHELDCMDPELSASADEAEVMDKAVDNTVCAVPLDLNGSFRKPASLDRTPTNEVETPTDEQRASARSYRSSQPRDDAVDQDTDRHTTTETVTEPVAEPFGDEPAVEPAMEPLTEMGPPAATASARSARSARSVRSVRQAEAEAAPREHKGEEVPKSAREQGGTPDETAQGEASNIPEDDLDDLEEALLFPTQPRREMSTSLS